MLNFDLHCHPSIKSFMGNINPKKRINCWTYVDIFIDFQILDSQSNLSQLKNGKVKLAVAGINGMERAFTRSLLFNTVLAGTTDKLDARFLRKIRQKKIGYNELMLQELAHLEKSKKVPNKGSFVFVNKISDFKPNARKLHLILCVEGGHNFHGKPGTGLQRDKNTIIQNLKNFKSGNFPRLLYITLTHLTKTVLCTHAYELKWINDKSFYPEGKGISATGRAFIKEALGDTNGKPVLIDIKHMSLESRLQYYKLRDDKKIPKLPIIASHMGVTGVSYTKMPIISNYKIKKECVAIDYQEPLGIGDTRFNPWSINLYDEDLKRIVASRGLIGVSLDQRILGFGDISMEYFSPQEMTRPKFNQYRDPNLIRYESNRFSADNIKKAYSSRSSMGIYHLKYLCNNILHIIKVTGERGWDHICIGADNDGLINPIDYCENMQSYPKLRSGLLQMLPAMARAAGIKAPNIKGKVENIMFGNAFNFLQKNFN